jgi:hypothetical protein
MREYQKFAVGQTARTVQDGVLRGEKQNEVIPVIRGAEHVDTTFFQRDGAHSHTANVVLDVLQYVFGSRAL